ncbi:MAG TPA: arylesterase [Gemmatimonadaceae bacterium]
MAALVVALACTRGESAPPGDDATDTPRAAVAATGRSLATEPADRNGAESTDATREPTVLFLGTSLTAGYGLDDPEDAYPAVVGRMLDSAGTRVHVLNLGVSGETSAGARARIDWVLRNPADVVVVETGANDGLRGLSVDAARDNIQAIIDRIRAKRPHARVLLVQMEAPPNLGARYTRDFHEMFPELARKNGVELVPFLLEGVAGDPSLNQPDGIHPNVNGARIAARTVFRALVRKPLVVTSD